MIEVREYGEADIESMTAIWNEVVASGVAFPQEEALAFGEAGARKRIRTQSLNPYIPGCAFRVLRLIAVC